MISRIEEIDKLLCVLNADPDKTWYNRFRKIRDRAKDLSHKISFDRTIEGKNTAILAFEDCPPYMGIYALWFSLTYPVLFIIRLCTRFNSPQPSNLKRTSHGETPQNVPTYLLAERPCSVRDLMCCPLD